jgi:TorA maturation chaperone TorD
VAEPEDHIASVCEMMAGFIDGSLGCALSLEEQKAFFAAHVGSWAPVLFRDMQEAKPPSSTRRAGIGRPCFPRRRGRAFAMV